MKDGGRESAVGNAYCEATGLPSVSGLNELWENSSDEH
jgi:hypothetical protein